MLKPLRHTIDAWLWRQRPGRPTALRLLQTPLRYLYAILRDAMEGDLTLRAMSLVYTTLLAIVPLIALSFSVLKAFGVHYQVQPLLDQFLSPLGEQGVEISNRIIGFVENTRGAALTTIGLVFLIYTVVSMVQKVEESFNYVWQVDSVRSFARRFSEYLSVIMIAPVLMLLAIGLAGSIASAGVTQKLMEFTHIDLSGFELNKAAPFVLVVAAFTFVYGFVPNTRVQFRSALLGGVMAGIAWSSVGAVFATFVASSARYTAIYSTFAIMILMLIWLYISWLVLLVGAKLSFYYQHPEHLRHGRRLLILNNALKERLAFQVMTLIANAFHSGATRWNTSGLAERLGLPVRTLTPVIDALEKSGLVAVSEDERLLPGRDLSAIPLTEILDAIRAEGSPVELETNSQLPSASAVVDTLDKAGREALAGRSLRDLLE